MRFSFCLFKYFPHGGLQRDFVRIAQNCLERGNRVQVYTLEWRGPVPEGLSVEVVKVLPLANHRRYRAFHRMVSQRLRCERPDLLVGFNKMPGLDVYYAADPCYQAKIAHDRGSWCRLGSRFRHFVSFEHAVFAPDANTQILILGEKEIRNFAKYYGTPAERFHILPPGIARDRMAGPERLRIRAELRAELGIAENDLLVLMVGSGFRTKGLDRALRALASLPAGVRDRTRLIVVGQDNPKPFQRLAARLGVAHRLKIFFGRDDVPRFLFGADLLIHPAYSESWGMILLEATVAGLPVLATDVCGYAPHIERAKAGWVLRSPFRQAALDQALRETLLSPQRQIWSRNGIAYGRSQDLYRMPDVAADLLDGLARECRRALSRP